MIGVTRSLPLFQGLRKTDYAVAYCGLCKAIGRVYSQRSRLNLNRDFVFLLECLTDADDKLKYATSSSYSSLNCFAMPRVEEIDARYRYCAAVNLLAVGYRVEDDVVDDNSLSAKLARRVFRSDLQAAREDLEKSGFPLACCDQALADLRSMETRGAAIQASPLRTIFACCEPIERLYGTVFRHGAALAGKDRQHFEALGRCVGRMT
jgi:hypothetical protein